MIKINLLESVTDKQGGAIVAVERKVASPLSRLIVMSVAVVALLVVICVGHFVNAQMNKAEAERQLEEQKKIATELEAVMKEQKDLEQKIQNIDLRIEAIKRLRGSQAGPSAVLEAMRERIAMVPGLYLDSVDQKGDQLTIKGNSPDESQVTQFGRSLEFSSGLFSNLNIETQRKDAQAAQTAAPDGTAPKGSELVNFTIRCAYTPSKAGGANSAQTANNQPAPVANQPASQPQPNAANPPQVAKNQDN